MANWEPITAADLRDNKVAALVEALQSAALGAGDTDPTPRITQDVVNRIRRKIASNTANQLDEDETTIPRGLKSDAVTLIIVALKGRLEYELTPRENDEVRRINDDLNRIAAGTDVVEQPDTAVAAEVQSPAPAPRIASRTKTFSRSQGDGL